MQRSGGRRRWARAAVASATAIFVGASLSVGVDSLGRDLARTYRDADASVFPPGFFEQRERVREVAPPRAGILLVASPADAWQARLWQRALYPRNEVVVRYAPEPGFEELERLRHSRRVDFVMALGPVPDGLTLAGKKDLGGMPGGPQHVWIGALEK